MKSDERIREGKRKEGDCNVENIMEREEGKNMLYAAVYNSKTRLPADFLPAIFITHCLMGV